MKGPPVILTSTFAVMSLLGLAGCGGEQASEHARSHGHSHGDEAQSFSGATYQEGKGITLLEETREILNIQTVEAQERELPREIRLLVRVFAAPRQAAMPGARHLAGKFLASGTLPASDARWLHASSSVLLKTESGLGLTGSVQRVEPSVTADEAEVIVAFAAPDTKVPPDSFLEARIAVPPGQAYLVVPQEALVRGADSDFVYVVNGEAYLRVGVQAGAEGDGLVEIRDGLLSGDSVVTQGALQLWLIELRAVKGGQGCCAAPAVRKKN